MSMDCAEDEEELLLLRIKALRSTPRVNIRVEFSSDSDNDISKFSIKKRRGKEKKRRRSGVYRTPEKETSNDDNDDEEMLREIALQSLRKPTGRKSSNIVIVKSSPNKTTIHCAEGVDLSLSTSLDSSELSNITNKTDLDLSAIQHNSISSTSGDPSQTASSSDLSELPAINIVQSELPHPQPYGAHELNDLSNNCLDNLSDIAVLHSNEPDASSCRKSENDLSVMTTDSLHGIINLAVSLSHTIHDKSLLPMTTISQSILSSNTLTLVTESKSTHNAFSLAENCQFEEIDGISLAASSQSLDIVNRTEMEQLKEALGEYSEEISDLGESPAINVLQSELPHTQPYGEHELNGTSLTVLSNKSHDNLSDIAALHSTESDVSTCEKSENDCSITTTDSLHDITNVAVSVNHTICDMNSFLPSSQSIPSTNTLVTESKSTHNAIALVENCQLDEIDDISLVASSQSSLDIANRTEMEQLNEEAIRKHSEEVSDINESPATNVEQSELPHTQPDGKHELTDTSQIVLSDHCYDNSSDIAVLHSTESDVITCEKSENDCSITTTDSIHDITNLAVSLSHTIHDINPLLTTSQSILCSNTLTESKSTHSDISFVGNCELEEIDDISLVVSSQSSLDIANQTEMEQLGEEALKENSEEVSDINESPATNVVQSELSHTQSYGKHELTDTSLNVLSNNCHDNSSNIAVLHSTESDSTTCKKSENNCSITTSDSVHDINSFNHTIHDANPLLTTGQSILSSNTVTVSKSTHNAISLVGSCQLEEIDDISLVASSQSSLDIANRTEMEQLKEALKEASEEVTANLISVKSNLVDNSDNDSSYDDPFLLGDLNNETCQTDLKKDFIGKCSPSLIKKYRQFRPGEYSPSITSDSDKSDLEEFKLVGCNDALLPKISDNKVDELNNLRNEAVETVSSITQSDISKKYSDTEEEKAHTSDGSLSTDVDLSTSIDKDSSYVYQVESTTKSLESQAAFIVQCNDITSGAPSEKWASSFTEVSSDKVTSDRGNVENIDGISHDATGLCFVLDQYLDEVAAAKKTYEDTKLSSDGIEDINNFSFVDKTKESGPSGSLKPNSNIAFEDEEWAECKPGPSGYLPPNIVPRYDSDSDDSDVDAASVDKDALAIDTISVKDDSIDITTQKSESSTKILSANVEESKNINGSQTVMLKSDDIKNSLKEQNSVCNGSREDLKDVTCSICLGPFENRSFLNMCFHSFCYMCIVQWSELSRLCPLCKTNYTSLIHSVNSDLDYLTYEFPEELPSKPSEQQRLEFSETMADGRRFRYRSTMVDHEEWESRRSEQERIEQEHMMSRQRRRIRRRLKWSATRGRRKRVYLKCLIIKEVKQRGTPKFRDITPKFFQDNPALKHRLVPWLLRDLNVLLGNEDENIRFVMTLILNLISKVSMESKEFKDQLNPFLFEKTHQFVNELISFASSPYDIQGYDTNVRYRQPNKDTVTTLIEDDSDDEVVAVETISSISSTGVLSDRDARDDVQLSNEATENNFSIQSSLVNLDVGDCSPLDKDDENDALNISLLADDDIESMIDETEILPSPHAPEINVSCADENSSSKNDKQSSDQDLRCIDADVNIKEEKRSHKRLKEKKKKKKHKRKSKKYHREKIQDNDQHERINIETSPSIEKINAINKGDDDTEGLILTNEEKIAIGIPKDINEAKNALSKLYDSHKKLEIEDGELDNEKHFRSHKKHAELRKRKHSKKGKHEKHKKRKRKISSCSDSSGESDYNRSKRIKIKKRRKPCDEQKCDFAEDSNSAVVKKSLKRKSSSARAEPPMKKKKRDKHDKKEKRRKHKKKIKNKNKKERKECKNEFTRKCGDSTSAQTNSLVNEEKADVELRSKIDLAINTIMVNKSLISSDDEDDYLNSKELKDLLFNYKSSKNLDLIKDGDSYKTRAEVLQELLSIDNAITRRQEKKQKQRNIALSVNSSLAAGCSSASKINVNARASFDKAKKKAELEKSYKVLIKELQEIEGHINSCRSSLQEKPSNMIDSKQ